MLRIARNSVDGILSRNRTEVAMVQCTRGLRITSSTVIVLPFVFINHFTKLSLLLMCIINYMVRLGGFLSVFALRQLLNKRFWFSVK